MDCDNNHHWFQSPLFNNYWRHYRACVEWLKENNINPFIPDLSHTEDEGLTFQKEVHHVNLESDRQEDVYSLQRETKENIDLDDPLEEEEKESVDSMEICPEYLEFVMITRRHQEERQRMKLLKKESQKVSYRDISTLDDPSLKQARSGPTDQLVKRLQYTQWYGSQAEEIAIMESKIQSTFDDFLQKKKPSFFPSCPINMTAYFDG